RRVKEGATLRDARPGTSDLFCAERNRHELLPAGIRDLDGGELDRLGDAFRPRHADDGPGDARIPDRELQRCGGQGDAMPATDLLERFGAPEHRLVGGAVSVSWVLRWPLGKDAAPVRRGV